MISRLTVNDLTLPLLMSHLVRWGSMITLLLCLAMTSTAAGQSPAVATESLRTRSDGGDWPCFLGPTFDGKSTESGIRIDWSEGRCP